MPKKIVTLYVNDTSLRLMVTDGKQIKEWAEVPLEPGLVENTVVIKEDEFVDKIKQLFEIQEVTTRKVIVVIGGFHSLTRPITLPQLPKEMIGEAVEREAERVLPVPLGQLYTSWQTIPGPADKTQVFMVAIPRETVDTLFRALHKAGLNSHFMDLKPLILARIATEATAIIVDMQATEFDIVIMTGGVPQPIRTILFPSEVTSWEEKLSTIRNELDRTITFYNSNNPENPLDPSIPIFTSGELADEPEMSQALSSEIGRPVLPLSSPLESPEGFVPNHYMVNIGLTLQALSPGKTEGASVVNLNVLPALYQPKPISLTNILVPSGAAVATVSLALLVMLTQITAADIATKRDQLETTEQLLQQKLTQNQALSKEISRLEKAIKDTETSRKGFSTTLSNLEKQKSEVILAVEESIKSSSSRVGLNSITWADGILTLKGRATYADAVIDYFRRLDRSEKLGEVAINSMIVAGGENIDFTLSGDFDREGTTSSTGVIVNNLPGSLTLTGIRLIEGNLTIDGLSPNEAEVLSYIDDLESSGTFSMITITSLTTTGDGKAAFSMILRAEPVSE